MEVRRADRRIATFRIYAIQEYEKRDFPSAGGYQSNVVAFARLTSVRPA